MMVGRRCPLTLNLQEEFEPSIQPSKDLATCYFFAYPGGHFGFLFVTLTLYFPLTQVMVLTPDGELDGVGAIVDLGSAFSPGTN